MDETEHITLYLELIEWFTTPAITPFEFSQSYVNMYLDDMRLYDETPFSEDTYDILHDLFVEADAYCKPSIRAEVSSCIDEEELLEAAREASAALEHRLQELDD
ncbi:colicin immunity domain-containing protein [Halovivax cerinus]|uniref:Colicin immunity domain-containing protein n=1 Tax=Halovivax cerinus TaxID=1487865 RepID=A0ABD5NKD6_9EURY|nr:colicin immunity domain-containing protein [Halovivax cerinus]